VYIGRDFPWHKQRSFLEISSI
jgi:hypothetical protein